MAYHWRKLEFGYSFAGHKIDGDTRMPKTKSWNAWFLRWLCWQKVSVFRVPAFNGKMPIYVGFSCAAGSEYRVEPLTCSDFAVKVGREPCTFFCFHCLGDPKTTVKMELSVLLLATHLHRRKVPAGVEWV